jgi:hypothetical protein
MNKIFSSTTVGAALILIHLCTTACSLPNPYHATITTQEASMDSSRGNGRYPADIDHLEEILSIGEGHELPEGAEVISVKPSTNFAARYPGGWGYVIAFTATDSAIRDYVTTYIGLRGENVEKYGGVKREDDWLDGLEDIDFTGITDPWTTGFGDTVLLLERPLGRGWLIIRGAPR